MNNKVKPNSLSVILNNPFYTGIIDVKGTIFNANHEPTISTRSFQEVQKILRGNTNQKVIRHDFKFKKMISCKECGNTLTAELQKGHIYYRCHTKRCVLKGMRETTAENFLLKSFAAAQLYEEEGKNVDELLEETEHEWIIKQEDLLKSLVLQKNQLKQKLERLTDCYVDGQLDKEIFETRKKQLLLELKTKEAAEQQLLQGNTSLFNKAKQFFELARSLIKSYEKGILEEKRDLLETATSNLETEGKKLIISMRSPFLELKNRWNVHYGAPSRVCLRKTPEKYAGSGNRNDDSKLIFSDINTSPIIGKPLSKDQLRPLVKLILEVIAELPDDNNEAEYAL